MLKCYMCKQLLPESEFNKSKSGRGYQSNCRNCMKAYKQNFGKKYSSGNACTPPMKQLILLAEERSREYASGGYAKLLR